MFWVLVRSHIPIVLSLKANQVFLTGLRDDLSMCARAVESRRERVRMHDGEGAATRKLIFQCF